MTASMDDGSRSSSAWRESAKCTVASVPACARRGREIVGHPADPLQPGTDDRRVFLDPSRRRPPDRNAGCRCPRPASVARASLSCPHERRRRGTAPACRAARVSCGAAAGLIEFFSSKTQPVGRQRPELRVIRRSLCLETGASHAEIVDAFARGAVSRARSADSPWHGRNERPVRIDAPVHLGPARETGPSGCARSRRSGCPASCTRPASCPCRRRGSRTRCVESTPNVWR